MTPQRRVATLRRKRADSASYDRWRLRALYRARQPIQRPKPAFNGPVAPCTPGAEALGRIVDLCRPRQLLRVPTQFRRVAGRQAGAYPTARPREVEREFQLDGQLWCRAAGGE